MRLSYDDVTEGDVLPSVTATAARIGIVQYAGASGDFNPIHTQEDHARAVGLPGTIAHGMFTMGAAIRVVTAWAGDPGAVVTYGVRFSSPVPVPPGFEGTPVQVGGVVKAKLDDRRVKVDLTVTVDGSKVLLGASATVQLA